MITGEEVVSTFIQYPWKEELALLNSLPEDKRCSSPSLEFSDTEDHSGICFSFIGNAVSNEFMVFYKRIKGGVEYMDDIDGVNPEYARSLLEAFLRNDTAYLEEKISGK